MHAVAPTQDRELTATAALQLVQSPLHLGIHARDRDQLGIAIPIQKLLDRFIHSGKAHSAGHQDNDRFVVSQSKIADYLLALDESSRINELLIDRNAAHVNSICGGSPSNQLHAHLGQRDRKPINLRTSPDWLAFVIGYDSRQSHFRPLALHHSSDLASADFGRNDQIGFELVNCPKDARTTESKGPLRSSVLMRFPNPVLKELIPQRWRVFQHSVIRPDIESAEYRPTFRYDIDIFKFQID